MSTRKDSFEIWHFHYNRHLCVTERGGRRILNEATYRISFSFRLHRFVGNLSYLLEPGKKPSTDLDLEPAKFPSGLNLDEELKANKDPREAEPKSNKKRKRLTFDEVSNVVLEGVGNGPLRSRKELEAAAKKLKVVDESLALV